MSTASLTSPYLSITSFGILVHVISTFSVGCLVVFPFKETILGPNISYAHMMSSLVMLQLGIILSLTYLIRSSVLGLPIVLCKK